MNLRLHKGDVDSVVHWVMPPEEDAAGNMVASPPAPPTIFYHPGYFANDIYPGKLGDVVGYWAEDRIFGGVVIFNRKGEAEASAKDHGADANMPNFYLHACRRRVTNRITQVSDDQQDALLAFFSSESPSPDSCPLPIILDFQNRVRVEVYDATTRGIYRDVWERRPLSRRERSILVRRPRAWID